MKWATLMIVSYKSTALPVLTKLTRIIIEQVRFAPEVLPVVCILAFGLIMVICKIWAPLCLKVVHVEVIILGILVD